MTKTKRRTKPLTIEYGKWWAKFSQDSEPAINGPNITMSNYKQHDIHSCGFIAALTVIKYLRRGTFVNPIEILRVARPSVDWGVSNGKMVKTLKEFGISVSVKTTLTIDKLIELVEKGFPVIVSVWLTDWNCDHWTVVRGFSKNEEYIYLSNYGRYDIETFESEWFEHGEGIVCS